MSGVFSAAASDVLAADTTDVLSTAKAASGGDANNFRNSYVRDCKSFSKICGRKSERAEAILGLSWKIPAQGAGHCSVLSHTKPHQATSARGGKLFRG